MATLEQFTQALARVEQSTTEGAASAAAIAVRIAAMELAIKSMGLTAEQETTLLAQLEGVAPNVEALAAALKPMATDPSNPVPVAVPDPLPPVDPGPVVPTV